MRVRGDSNKPYENLLIEALKNGPPTAGVSFLIELANRGWHASNANDFAAEAIVLENFRQLLAEYLRSPVEWGVVHAYIEVCRQYLGNVAEDLTYHLPISGHDIYPTRRDNG